MSPPQATLLAAGVDSEQRQRATAEKEAMMPQTLSPKPSTTADLEARPPMLEVVNATHRYGEVLALDGVTVVARQGEFLTILGESGSGKTTLLRIISGLERPTEAEAIRIGGADVSELGASDRDCTTVFQHYALFPCQ